LNDLDPSARALLEAAREHEDPSPADRWRLQSDFARRVGPAALATAIPVGAALTGGTAAAAAASGGVLVKTLAALAIVGAVGGGTAYSVRARTRPPAPASALAPAPHGPQADLSSGPEATLPPGPSPAASVRVVHRTHSLASRAPTWTKSGP
jgi:hypothetical protein